MSSVSSRRSLVLGAALLLLGSCRDEPESPVIAPGTLQRSVRQARRHIGQLHPAEARVGEIFQKQPDGNAAMAITGSGFKREDTVYWNGTALQTTFGNSTLVTAEVPAGLLGRPGEIAIVIRGAGEPPDGEARATFILRPGETSGAN